MVTRLFDLRPFKQRKSRGFNSLLECIIKNLKRFNYTLKQNKNHTNIHTHTSIFNHDKVFKPKSLNGDHRGLQMTWPWLNFPPTKATGFLWEKPTSIREREPMSWWWGNSNNTKTKHSENILIYYLANLPTYINPQINFHSIKRVCFLFTKTKRPHKSA